MPLHLVKPRRNILISGNSTNALTFKVLPYDISVAMLAYMLDSCLRKFPFFSMNSQTYWFDEKILQNLKCPEILYLKFKHFEPSNTHNYVILETNILLVLSFIIGKKEGRVGLVLGPRRHQILIKHNIFLEQYSFGCHNKNTLVWSFWTKRWFGQSCGLIDW